MSTPTLKEYFAKSGVQVLETAEDARRALAEARAVASCTALRTGTETATETETETETGSRPHPRSNPVRGQSAVTILARAAKALATDPRWSEKIRHSIDDFRAVAGGPADVDHAMAAELGSFLDAALWRQKLELELPLPRAADGLYENTRTDALLSYQALGVVLHICPGNSFLGGIDSFLHGLVAGNVNLVKLSRGTPAVAAVLVELLESCGLPPGQVTPVLWDAGAAGIEEPLKSGVDGVVVWGGDAVIHAYKSGLGSGIRFIEYGPKLSFSVLTAGARDDEAALAGLVRDACQYEQASCSSSQLLFVEMPEAIPAQMPEGVPAEEFRRSLLRRLGEKFSAHARAFPPGAKSKHEQLEILKALERAKLARALGRGDFESGYPDWLLVFSEPDQLPAPSPLFRTWLIHPYRDAADLARLLTPVRHYLQTASVACGAGELTGLTEQLWSLGVNRVVAAGRSTVATAGAPHDGGYILAQFSRLVSLESPTRSAHLWQLGSSDAALAGLGRHLESIRSSPFYARRLEAAGIGPAGLRSWDEFHRIPWLRKEDIHQYGPPLSSELLTVPFAEAGAAYLFTTGGSTGEPKYALYSRPEWDEVSDIFCREFQALGLTANDRAANLFNGGGLWSAFIAVTEAFEKLGCLNLPVGGSMEPRQVLEIFKTFGVTAVFGLPSTLLRLAHTAVEHPELAVKIPRILYGGEHMSEPMRLYVQKVFSAELVKSGSYAAVDAGCIGYQCLDAAGGVQHVLESYCHLEICDEVSGRPVAPGEIGEIVVTNLSRKLYPIVRLRTGDRGRQLHADGSGGRCACGSSAMTFELLGRSDDMVRAGGANIFVSDVEKLCLKLSAKLSLMYQLRIGKAPNGVDDAYELCIETGEPVPVADLAALTAEATREYLALADEVKHYVDEGLLRHFRLSLLPPGALAGNSRTGKIRRVIDARH